MNKALKRLIRGVIIVGILVAARLVVPGMVAPETGDIVKFFTVFLAILFTFIFSIAVIAAVLEGKVPPKIFDKILLVFVVGIVGGVIGMFQPWSQDLFRIAFHVLAFSLAGFMVWSHVTPARVEEEDELPLPLDVSDAVEARS